MVTRLRLFGKETGLLIFYLVWVLIYFITWGSVVFQRPDVIDSSDFLASYTAARIVLMGESERLYDFTLQKEIQSPLSEAFVPPDGVLPFMNPPFIALVFSPLGYLSIRQAFFVIFFINLLLLGSSIWLLARYLPGLSQINRGVLLLGGYSFFAYFISLIQGQNSALSLFLLTLTFIMLKQKRDGAAGVFLALTAYKPQLSLLFILYALFKKRWRMVFAYGITGSILVAISYFLVGTRGFVDYVSLTLLGSPLVDGAYGIHYSAMHNWRGFFRVLLGPENTGIATLLVALFSLITLALLGNRWRKPWDVTQSSFDLTYALTVLATALISPHLNTHDLTLWLLVGLLIVNAVYLHQSAKLNQGFMLSMIVFANFIPLITRIIGRTMHLQFTVLYMVLVFLIIAYHPDYQLPAETPTPTQN